MARIPAAAAEKILRKTGSRVSDNAKEALRDILEDSARSIGRQAAELAGHSGRKTIMDADVAFVLKGK